MNWLQELWNVITIPGYGKNKIISNENKNKTREEILEKTYPGVEFVEETPTKAPAEETPTKAPAESEIPTITNGDKQGVINYNEMFEYAEKMRNEQWEREDAIRKETQAREDTAYQRASEDARRAGINLNLIDLKPASSGGGITNATGMDATLPSDVLNGAINEILQEQQGEIEKSLEKLKQEFEKGENWKDNGTDVLTQLISSVVTMIVGSMIAKK